MGLLQRILRKVTGLTAAEATDPALFDPTYYLSTNPDLGGLTPGQAREHWQREGLDEGRQASPHFSAREYLEAYPDLASALGIHNYRQAAVHYLLRGRREGRRGRCPDEVLRLAGREIVLKSSRNWGNAVWSLRWADKEFVNSHDAGRCLVVAWQEDGLLERRNPTEGGNLFDCARSRCCGPSTSRPLQAEIDGKTLVTSTRPAYWLPPGHPDSKAEHLLSPSTLKKTVTPDYLDNPHLVRWQVDIHFRGQTSRARNQVQMLTLFSYGEFRNFWAFHAQELPENRLKRLNIGEGDLWDPCGLIIHSRRGDLSDAVRNRSRLEEVRRLLTPKHGGVIVSNDTGSHAIGLYGNSAADGRRHRGWSMAGPEEMGWATRNILHLDADRNRGLPNDNGAIFLCSVSRFRCREGEKCRFVAYLVVGTLDNVTEGMDQLCRHSLEQPEWGRRLGTDGDQRFKQF